MNKLKPILFLLLAASTSLEAQYTLTGNLTAFYFGTKIESCLVNLTGFSPASKNDSTYTDINGDYLLQNVPGGVYKIYFSHPLYRSDSTDLTLTSDAQKSYDLVRSKHIFDAAWPDTLKIEDSPVFPASHISKPLVINPGVKIVFIKRLYDSLFAALYVGKGGRLIAKGTKNDTIVFSSSYEDSVIPRVKGSPPWFPYLTSDIVLTDSSSIFKYCRFEAIRSVDLRYGKGSSFENCHFVHMEHVMTFYLNYGDLHFANNLVEDFGWFGAPLYGHYGKPYISDNLFRRGFQVQLYAFSGLCNFYVRRNTFLCDVYIPGLNGGFGDTIVSNIFISPTSSASAFFAYNGIDASPGVDSRQTVNVNGDSSDFFFNFWEDLWIADSTTGVLYQNSPCIGAGFQGENCGVYQGNGIPTTETENAAVIPAAEPNLLAISPNPLNPKTTIRFQGSAMPSIRIYDLNGHLIRNWNATASVIWNGQDLHGRDVASGTYIVRVKAGDRILTKRLALIR